jgi:hypothetical protein
MNDRDDDDNGDEHDDKDENDVDDDHDDVDDDDDDDDDDDGHVHDRQVQRVCAHPLTSIAEHSNARARVADGKGRCGRWRRR